MQDTAHVNLAEAPTVTMPIELRPTDCLPELLAAARVAPIVRTPYLDQHAWVVCDRELVKQALTHPKLGKDVALAPDWMRQPGQMVTAMPPPEYARMMVMSDGEHHARIRRIHAPVLSPRNTGRWSERVAALIAGFLDNLDSADGTEVNLITDYTQKIPLAFTAEMLGLPPGVERRLHDITEVMLYSADYALRQHAVGELFEAVQEWVRDPAELRDGVITGLLASTDGPDARVTEGEAIVWTLSLIINGYETTGSLISAALYEALRRPAPERPHTDEAVAAWIEETLRVQPPVPHTTWRFALADLDLGGYLIPKGAPVQISLAAANLDPDEAADSFDAQRRGRGHLSFGLGAHYCIGAPLARVQTKIALRGFLRRFPQARLSADTAPRWESEWMIRRMSVLPVLLA